MNVIIGINEKGFEEIGEASSYDIQVTNTV